MEEIRFTESDENYLFLETLEGNKFKLAVDDALRAAVRHQGSPRLSDDTLSPREIQDRIRSGSTVAEVASETGASESLIAKFAAPVLDELAHIVSSAQSVRLSVASDRPNVVEHVEFGQVVESRLRASGAVNLSWAARKLEGNTWRIAVDFALGDQPQTAAWLFELRKLTLAPENDMAIRLSTEEVVSSASAPSLVAVEPVDMVSAPSMTATPQQLVAEVEDDAHSLAHQADIEEAMTIDLLDALRKKREARKEKPAEPAPSGPIEPAAEAATDLQNETSSAASPEPAAESLAEELNVEVTSDPSIKKGRASMPSWDQIVFGTKAED
jgi:hypothetical protein